MACLHFKRPVRRCFLGRGEPYLLWHRLNFFPLPHGQRWFLPSFFPSVPTAMPRLRLVSTTRSISGSYSQGSLMYPKMSNETVLPANEASAIHSSAWLRYLCAKAIAVSSCLKTCACAGCEGAEN